MKSLLILLFISQVLSKKSLDVSNLLDLEIKFHKIVYKADSEETVGDVFHDDFNATHVRMSGFISLKRESPATVSVDQGDYLLEYELSVPNLEMKIENLIVPSLGEFKNISVKFEENRLRKVLEHRRQKDVTCKVVSGMEWIVLKGAKWPGQEGEAVDKFFDSSFKEGLNSALLRKSEGEDCEPIGAPFTSLFL